MSSHPGILVFWNSLSEQQKQNPFYRGYAWHLLTDKLIYARLDIDLKFWNFIESNKGNLSTAEIKKIALNDLHEDWDKTNARIRDAYPDVVLPPEVMELGVVQFIDNGELHYVDWMTLKESIDFLKDLDALNADMEMIIEIMTKWSIK